MTDTHITLECGCEIDFIPPHGEGCKCHDPEGTCRTGYWEMSDPCMKHQYEPDRE